MTAPSEAQSLRDAVAMTRDEIENRIACLLHPQPDMSGRQINRIHGERRRQVEDLASDIDAHIAKIEAERDAVLVFARQRNAAANSWKELALGIEARAEAGSASLYTSRSETIAAEAQVATLTARIADLEAALERIAKPDADHPEEFTGLWARCAARSALSNKDAGHE